MFPFTSPLLQRLRTATVVMLLVVLPLQGAVQWVAGLQGQRHVHTGHAGAVASPSALRLLLDRLHAAQPARLKALGAVHGESAAHRQPHAHGGVVHIHGEQASDAVPVADADDAGRAGATLFLAWLPAMPGLSSGQAGQAPGHVAPWRPGRVVAPALAPPRG